MSIRSKARQMAGMWGLAMAMSMLGCSTAPSVQRPVIVPAESSTASSLRRIAVLPFDRRVGGPDITAEVETMLAAVQVNGQPYFTVVERNKIQQLMKELKLPETGAIREDTAARVGQMLGANGVYAGSITRSEVLNQSYQESRSRCVRTEQKKDKNGNMVDGKCQKWQDHNVSCRKRTAYFTFLPKLISVESGSIAFSKEATGEASDAACHGEPKDVADGAQLLANARSTAIGQLRVAVAPSVQMVTIRYMDSSDGMTSGMAKEKHASALAFAREGRSDRACAIWSEVIELDPKAVSVIHNLGTCEEQRGNLSSALQRYNEADGLTSRPDKTIGESLARVKAMIENRPALQRQGVK